MKNTIFTKTELLVIIINQFKLDLDGYHGIEHWESVYRNCLLFSQHMNIKSEIFEYFSLLHDSKRIEEYDDRRHGYRAAKYISKLHKEGLIQLNKNDLKTLIFAVSNHTITNKNSPYYNNDIVKICLDADRFDLERVGITPDVKYFATDIAKNLVKELYELPVLNGEIS